jgi:hypothetical protein
LQARGFVASRKAFETLIRQADSLARTDKHSATAGMLVLVRKDSRLFIRAQSPAALLQTSLPVDLTGSWRDVGVTEPFRAALETKKLLAAVRALRKGADVKVQVLKASVKLGGARVAFEEPVMFGAMPPGVKDAKIAGSFPNPLPWLKRASHCMSDTKDAEVTARYVAGIPGRVVVAHSTQAIAVDCNLVGQENGVNRFFVSGKDLLRIEALGEVVSSFISSGSLGYLVLRDSASNVLALKQQAWSEVVERVLDLFDGEKFIDEINADRDELLTALKSTSKILDPHTIAKLEFRPHKGRISSTNQGDAVDEEFNCHTVSGKGYRVGVRVDRFLSAVEATPGEWVTIKVPDLSGAPAVKLHIIDNDAHEIIGLGISDALRETK